MKIWFDMDGTIADLYAVEGWLQMLYNTQDIDEAAFKKYRNLAGRIRRMLIASCVTLKEHL